MDDSRAETIGMSTVQAAATSPVNAFWFSFTYYARPALLEGVFSA